MKEALSIVTDEELQSLAALLSMAKSLDPAVQDLWLFYGSGLSDGYRMAKRDTDGAERAGA